MVVSEKAEKSEVKAEKQPEDRPVEVAPVEPTFVCKPVPKIIETKTQATGERKSSRVRYHPEPTPITSNLKTSSKPAKKKKSEKPPVGVDDQPKDEKCVPIEKKVAESAENVKKPDKVSKKSKSGKK